MQSDLPNQRARAFRLQELFLQAKDLPHQDRTPWLLKACGDDRSMLREIEELLACSSIEDDPLERGITSLSPLIGDTLDLHAPIDEDEIRAQIWREHQDQKTRGVSQLPATPPLPEWIPKQLGHYRLESVLGGGTFAVVIKAFDTKLERYVAIKLLTENTLSAEHTSSSFLEEARAAAAIRHPNIVGIYAVEDQPLPHLVLQYIDGPTLAQFIANTGPLSVADIIQIGMDVTRALIAAHNHHLIHRDIKPANILLDTENHNRAVLADFGLARNLSGESAIQTMRLAGTPQYMAPEQINSEKFDARADLFSLGCVLYHMATGKPPFASSTLLGVLDQIRSTEAVPINTIDPSFPASLGQLIARLMKKAPEDRYGSATELLNEFEALEPMTDERAAVLSTSGPTKTTNTIPIHTHNLPAGGQLRLRDRALWIAGTLIAIGIIIGLSFVLLPTFKKTEQASGSAPSESRVDSNSPPEIQVDASLVKEFAVLVSNTNTSRVSAKQAAPLENGDQVQCRLELSRAAYVKLFWIDPAGKVTELYPNEIKGPTHPLIVRGTVHSPLDPAAAWPIQGTTGVETVLLMASESPITVIPDELEGVDQISLDGDYLHLVATSNEQAHEINVDYPDRGIGEKVLLERPPLYRLIDRLRTRCDVVHVISIVHSEDANQH